ncbi:MAG: right-handed parallel beta-helix repeat-containing protein [Kofleriaceae bacterium]
MPDGSCADEASVAFVAPAPAGTDNTLCTRTAPCTKVAKALATTRPFVKFSDVTDEGRVVTIDDQNVTLLAEPGAKLVRTANGIVLEVKGASHVAIYDLEISGGSGSQGIGVSMPPGNTATLGLVRAKIINNAGGGISASGGSLTVSQSTISGNAGGGISVMNGTFEIVGNVFFNNGAQTGSVGGVSITTSQNAANRLEFNSFNKNQAQAGIGAAVHCVAGTFTAKNNILSENGTLTNMNQVGGTCEHTYSIVRPGPLPPGTGNSTDDPMFANTTTGNLHVMPGSPARNAADPASDLTGIAERDLDGDKRTPPADIGADEVP